MTALRYTHRAHMGRAIERKPRFESRPYRMHPARREHLYGRTQPMDTEQSWPGWLKLLVAGFGVLAVCVTMNGGRF